MCTSRRMKNYLETLKTLQSGRFDADPFLSNSQPDQMTSVPDSSFLIRSPLHRLPRSAFSQTLSNKFAFVCLAYCTQRILQLNNNRSSSFSVWFCAHSTDTSVGSSWLDIKEALYIPQVARDRHVSSGHTIFVCRSSKKKHVTPHPKRYHVYLLPWHHSLLSETPPHISEGRRELIGDGQFVLSIPVALLPPFAP